MKFFLVSIVMIISFSGCVTLDEPALMPIVTQIAIKEDYGQLTNMRHIHLGMTSEEVKSIMGADIKVGYKSNSQVLGGFEPIKLKNPYRGEIIKSRRGNDVYFIKYYYTDVRIADGIISEDELVPLVFKKGKLIGKGKDYLFKLKDKLRI